MKYLLIIILLSSCHTYRWGYAKAKMSHYKGEVKVQLMERVKDLPDTTMEVFILRKY